MDVAIIGLGMHPFGRSPHKTGLQQGAEAAREALADAGLSWNDIECGYGGSQDGGNADAIVNELGLSGLQFTNIFNGCATGGSSLHEDHNTTRMYACHKLIGDLRGEIDVIIDTRSDAR